MKTDLLHPEDLLDRGRRGTLLPGEQRDLARHRAECVACALEGWFGRDARPGDEPLAPADDLVVKRAIEAAVSRHPARGVAPPPARRRHTMAWAAAVLILCTGMAGGAAAVWSARRARQVEMRFDPPAPAVVRLAEPAPVEPALAAPTSNVPPALPPSGSVAPVPRPGARGSSEIFAHANRARMAQRNREAARFYEELQRRFPGSQEGLLSRVTFGRLLLDRLDAPARSLVQFDSYLADSVRRPLREEALIGRALALEKLRRPDEARRTWATLLSEFPDSLYAERARAGVVGRR